MIAGVVAGINWVIREKITKGGPHVANLSLGGPRSPIMRWAVFKATLAGVVMVLAAGNEDFDACFYSPSNSNVGITVGATDINDRRADYSNYGPCVDLFAPGTDIRSTWVADSTATKSISGTS